MADNALLDDRSPRDMPGWQCLLAVLLFYAACIFCATYPALLTPTTHLVGNRCDPLQALWLMHWYKDCLLQGRSPLHCSAIQYPVGAPLGNFSPLHFQTLLYVPLSLVFANDVFCYNAIWFFNVCFTGMGSFVLVWYVLRDRVCACCGGVLVLLSGPVLLHAHGHIELITLGWLPLFMVGWIRWVDRPSKDRFLLALLLYFMVALSAAYFAVFALVPAVVYVVWRYVRAFSGALQGCAGVMPTLPCGAPLNGALVRLSAFALAAAAGSLLIYFPQIWSRLQGYSLPRPKGEFNYYGAPLWSFLVPSYQHALGRLLPSDYYARSGSVAVECCSYLGAATIALLFYAALTKCRFQRAGYWWSVTLICAVLALGAYGNFGPLRICLPAEWLRKGVFAFQALRVPARFNLCVSVFAAVPAAAGLRHLLAQLPGLRLRATLSAAVCLLTVVDLSMVPFPTSEIPRLPACYAVLRARKPDAAWIDVPQLGSGICTDLGSACTYWQARHHSRTTAGYSGYNNVVYDNLLFQPSPFAWPHLAQADYLHNPDAVSVDLVAGTRFEDYAWLYLSVHRLDYIVLHQEPGLADEYRVAVRRLKPLLRHAQIFEDQDTAVYDRTLLRLPQRPTLLCTDGWRHRNPWKGRHTCAVARLAHMAVFNPVREQPLAFIFEVAALHRSRMVRLLTNGRELARWEIGSDELGRYTSPEFHLPAGLSSLVLESDGEERPARLEVTYEGDRRPYSFRVAAVGLLPVYERK
jgi:hypothetical protein